ncbi:oxidoreductase [Mycobacterium sp. MYCO198283]|uniref:FAD-dependent oxidoreductase n=1 Tax=Mycobacterium sp. MYCO198283 TaxID=2883505 RepID=UPI001E5DFF6F|nr:oxidoreductase [Mycobacterium sp. MYCO198283]MCG5431618.1 oxidoreductase [Mycobacterium sp. MYCO198283]
MGWSTDHAVVIGGSIAGMCAARVLSDVYDRVTVFERDELPEQPANRTAVPQGRHVHLLMARGAAEFDALFPGLLDEMVAAGVPMLENRPDCIHFGAAGHVLGTQHTLREEFTAYVPSRPHLEWQIRRRALAIPNVELVRRGVSEPAYDPTARRVTGVVLDAGGERSDGECVGGERSDGECVGGERSDGECDAGERSDGECVASTVAADLVVDATGRGTRLPVWLETWGYGRPREDTVDVGITYATHRVHIPEGLLREKVVVAGASREQPIGLGALYYEDGNWNVTTFGTGKAEPPRTFDEICALADEILPAHFAHAMRQGTPLGEMAFHKYPMSRWRRYDKMAEFPEGIIPFGDAVVSFNPTYGQGMTMTSLQAGNLRTALAAGPAGLPRRLAKATAKTTFPVWMMNAIGDHALHNASGPAPRWYGPVGGLFDQFLGAAETDPVLAEWFLRRFSLLDSLYMVPSPKVLGRTIRHNMGALIAEKRAARRRRQPVAAGR